MTLDISTIQLAGGFVTVASGVLLMTQWWRDRTSLAAFWWAVANIMSGVGITAMSFQDIIPSRWQVATIMTTGSGTALMGVAAWIFNSGSVNRNLVITCLGLGIGLSGFAAAFGYGRLEIVSGPGVSGCIFTAAAIKFWLGRNEALGGRMPMVGVLGLQAFALMLLTFGASSPAMLKSPKVMLGVFGAIQFVQFIYAIGSAVFLVMMLKDRTEAKHKLASLTDPLTGLPNRRAFMEQGQRYINRCNHEQTAISLLAFDLDKFKTINDAFGHPFGDHVLRVFGDVLTRVVRPTDKIARTGGEEFMAMLPACDSREAVAAANRVRLAFESDAHYVNGQMLNATVSVGVATAAGCVSIDDLIVAADEALYRAKALGRNRVVLASAKDNVIRVA